MSNIFIILSIDVVLPTASVDQSFAQIFTSNIDAAFLSEDDDKLYLLKGDQYVRLTFIVEMGAPMDEGYPQPLSNWVGLSS